MLFRVDVITVICKYLEHAMEIRWNTENTKHLLIWIVMLRTYAVARMSNDIQQMNSFLIGSSRRCDYDNSENVNNAMIKSQIWTMPTKTKSLTVFTFEWRCKHAVTITNLQLALTPFQLPHFVGCILHFLAFHAVVNIGSSESHSFCIWIF